MLINERLSNFIKQKVELNREANDLHENLDKINRDGGIIAFRPHNEVKTEGEDEKKAGEIEVMRDRVNLQDITETIKMVAMPDEKIDLILRNKQGEVEGTYLFSASGKLFAA